MPELPSGRNSGGEMGPEPKLLLQRGSPRNVSADSPRLADGDPVQCQPADTPPLTRRCLLACPVPSSFIILNS